MVFHIDTDRRSQIVPWVNYALIAANLLAFMFVDVPRSPGLYLWPHQPLLPQFFTYQFLHNDLMHILGNMLFLWVFGNHVEERFGHVGYLFFYLASGVLGGVAHILPVDAPPVIGASGAVAGVTGAFLAFYPLTTVEIDVAFLGEFEVSSIVLILFRIATDAAFSLFGIGDVAYTAHLAGYLFGFSAAVLVLSFRFVPREEHDMLSLIAGDRGGSPPRSGPRGGDGDGGIGGGAMGTGSDAERRRAEITDALVRQQPAIAARRYEELLADHPDEVMPIDPQLELANQLLREGRYAAAARAYELFLTRYPDYPDLAQVRFVLGLVYAKQPANPARARELLEFARPHLNRPEQARVDDTLARLRA